MSNIIAQPLTAVSTTQVMPLGTIHRANVTLRGKLFECEFQYVVTASAVTAGVITSFTGATPYEVDNGLTAASQNLLGAGLAMATATAGSQYIWVLREGVDSIGAKPTVATLSSVVCDTSTGVLTIASDTWTDQTLNVGYATVDDYVMIRNPAFWGIAKDVDNT